MRIDESAQEPTSEAPSTSSLMYGLWREGLKDLQNAVLDPWNGQVATHEEPGTIANPTQAMVTQDVGTVYGRDSHLPEIEAPQQQNTREMEIGE